MSEIKRPPGVKAFWRLHKWIYERTDGRIGSTFMGQKVLKLTTTGHKSGKPRSILIYYFDYSDGYVIVGSNLGADRDPAWYRNLQADPQARLQIGRKKIDALARTAEGQERQDLWDLIISQASLYQDYKDQTEREIPLVIFEPLP